MPAFLKTLDPKLVGTLLGTLLAHLALELGIAEDDPTLQLAISLVVGAVVGYLTPNEGTVLRTPQEDGNPEMP